MSYINGNRLFIRVQQDGFSPIVEVTEIESGHNVSITDVNGTQSFDVLDGSGILETYSVESPENVAYPTPAFGAELTKTPDNYEQISIYLIPNESAVTAGKTVTIAYGGYYSAGASITLKSGVNKIVYSVAPAVSGIYSALREVYNSDGLTVSKVSMNGTNPNVNGFYIMLDNITGVTEPILKSVKVVAHNL